MRRTLETLLRSSARLTVLVPAICGVVWLLSRHAWPQADVTPYPARSAYHVAFAAAALTLFLSASSAASAWSWSGQRHVAQIVVPVTLASLGLALVEIWTSVLPMSWSSAATASLGAAHLSLLGALTVRLTTSPGFAIALFLFATIAMPALLPSSRPLLDAAPSFHSDGFPRSPAVLAPILTLAVIVIALPHRPISASLRGDPE